MKQHVRHLSGLLCLLMVLSLVLSACHKNKVAEESPDKAATSPAISEDISKTTVTEAATTSETVSSSVLTKTDPSKTSGTVTDTVRQKPAGKDTTKAVSSTTRSAGLFQVSEDYKKNHPYAVAVNTSQNIVTVYQKGADGNYSAPVKAFAVSCGRAGHETPSGQYTVLAKQRWLYLIDGTYGQYCTKFKEHYWFHSVPYYTQDPSDLEYPEYNKLGNNASAGCVRMCVADVKWIYDHISSGTVVRVYSSSAKEPLAKPTPIRIDTSDANEKRGWDPTDPDPANPYK